MPLRLDTRAPGFAAAFDAFVAAKREHEDDVDAAVAAILDDVRKRGDEAVIALTRRFDRLELTRATMRVSPAEIAAARGRCGSEALAALDFAAERIAAYHRRQLPADSDYVDASGVRLGARWRPIEAVGIYVPGGTAS